MELRAAERATDVAFTVSLFGGKNATGRISTATLGDVNSDGILMQYMNSYTEFKVVATKVQVIFNNTGNFDIRPIECITCYSPNLIIHPSIEHDKINAMNTVRHHGTERPLVSYVNNERALKALVIEWCDTKEVLDGKFMDGVSKLYGD